MNEYQKAFDCLFLEIQNTYLSDDVEIYDESMSHFIPSFNLIKELVDKETPMKPIRVGQDYKCGKCKSYSVLDYSKSCGELKRCHNCGKKVDWSDEE